MPTAHGKMRQESILLFLREQKHQAAGHADQIHRTIQALREIRDAHPVGMGHRFSELVTEIPMFRIDEAMTLGGESGLYLGSIHDRATEIRPFSAEEKAFSIAEADHAEATTFCTCLAEALEEPLEGGRIGRLGIGPGGKRIAEAWSCRGIKRSSTLCILRSDLRPSLQDGERIDGGRQEG